MEGELHPVKELAWVFLLGISVLDYSAPMGLLVGSSSFC